MNLLDGLVIGLHLASAHSAGGFEAVTPGIYVTTESGLTGGVFRNSYGRGSAYAGWTFNTADRRFALTTGLVTGYPAHDVMPLVVPSVRIGLTDTVSLRTALLFKPPGEIGSSHALHLAIERDF